MSYVAARTPHDLMRAMRFEGDLLGFERCDCVHPVWLLSWRASDNGMRYIYYFCEPDPSLVDHEYPVPGLADCGDDQQRALICCIQAVNAQRRVGAEGDTSGTAPAAAPLRPHASLPVIGESAAGGSPQEES